MFTIKTAEKGINKYGARKYALVPSHSKQGVDYMVAKCRKRNAKHYYYVCSCPVNFYGRKTCKHIKDFKVDERGQ